MTEDDPRRPTPERVFIIFDQSSGSSQEKIRHLVEEFPRADPKYLAGLFAKRGKELAAEAEEQEGEAKAARAAQAVVTYLRSTGYASLAHACEDLGYEPCRAKLPGHTRCMEQYFCPDLLVSCKNASDLAEQLVREWLAAYMFQEDAKRKSKARTVAKWLSTHSHFKSHGRPIPRDTLRENGLNVVWMEDDQTAQDLFLSVFHAASHTFTQRGATKIIENHLGKAFIKLIQTQHIVLQQPPAQAEPATPKSAEPQKSATPKGAKRTARRKAATKKKSKKA